MTAAPSKELVLYVPPAGGGRRASHAGGRRTLLTDDTHARLVQYLQAGAFDHVAARAAGISPTTFYAWLAKGRDDVDAGRRNRHTELLTDVEEARARARLSAEVRVLAKDPLSWLRFGPGRDRPGADGWTQPAASATATAAAVVVIELSFADTDAGD